MISILEEQADALFKDYENELGKITTEAKPTIDILRGNFENVKLIKDLNDQIGKSKRDGDPASKTLELKNEKEKREDDLLKFYLTNFLFYTAEITFNIIAKKETGNTKEKTKESPNISYIQGKSWRIPKDWELHDKFIKEFATQESGLKKMKEVKEKREVNPLDRDKTIKQNLTNEDLQINRALIAAYALLAKQAYANNYGIHFDTVLELYEGQPYRERAKSAGFCYNYTDHERRSQLTYTPNEKIKKSEGLIVEGRVGLEVKIGPEGRGGPAVVAVAAVISAIAAVSGVVLAGGYYAAMILFSGVRAAPNLYPVMVFTRPKKCE